MIAIGRIAIDLPIIQAPMAGVQGSRLAIAVAKAGGLGSLPCAMLGVEGIRDEIGALKAQTARPFNVNFFCHQPPQGNMEKERAWQERLSPYYQELGIDHARMPAAPARHPFDAESADVLAALTPAVVSFHFGLPSEDLLARVRGLGAMVVASATTVEEARWLETRGADAIVAQGLEAGGHRGIFLSEDLTTQVGTFALVRQIVKAVSVPVIAAGGIADADGVRAALALGAVAAQVGTAYLLTTEATTSGPHRAQIKSPAAAHTAVTNVFTGRPARSIVNRLVREVGPMTTLAPEFPLALHAVAPLRAAAEQRGSSDFSPLWSGQNATACLEIDAGALTRQLAGVG